MIQENKTPQAKKKNPLRWYHFRQNNSGGRFIRNGDVDVNVLIQARSAKEANVKAEEVGLYFNGADEEEGLDCPCCGDRWYPQMSDKNGTATPKVYGKSPSQYQCSWSTHAIAYYANGNKKFIPLATSSPHP